MGNPVNEALTQEAHRPSPAKNKIFPRSSYSSVAQGGLSLNARELRGHAKTSAEEHDPDWLAKFNCQMAIFC